MPSFNQWIGLGHLTRDPQLKFLPSQTAICEFGFASNRKYKTASGEEREEVLFLDCIAFGKQAEILNQHVVKGNPIFLTGRLKLDSWDDKQTGAKRSKINLVVENFQFIGGRPEGGQQQAAPARGAMDPQRSPISDQQHYKEDDIPF